jgi:hypothetical protein
MPPVSSPRFTRPRIWSIISAGMRTSYLRTPRSRARDRQPQLSARPSDPSSCANLRQAVRIAASLSLICNDNAPGHHTRGGRAFKCSYLDCPYHAFAQIRRIWSLTRRLSPLVLLPEPRGFSQGIDLGVLPPIPFDARVMERAAMRVAERNDRRSPSLEPIARGWAKRMWWVARAPRPPQTRHGREAT